MTSGPFGAQMFQPAVGYLSGGQPATSAADSALPKPGELDRPGRPHL